MKQNQLDNLQSEYIQKSFIQRKKTKLNQPVNIQQIFEKLLKKTNPKHKHPTLKIKQTHDQLSLTDNQIYKITRKAIQDHKKSRNQKISVINMIKGKPYCLKLGTIDPNIDNFQGFYQTFYSNIYGQQTKERHQRKASLYMSKRIPITSNSIKSRPTSKTSNNYTIFFQNKGQKMEQNIDNKTSNHRIMQRASGKSFQQMRFRTIKTSRPRTSQYDIIGQRIDKSIEQKSNLSRNFDTIINNCNALLKQKNEKYEVHHTSRKSTQLQCFKN